jgi:hypothetical protein
MGIELVSASNAIAMAIRRNAIQSLALAPIVKTTPKVNTASDAPMDILAMQRAAHHPIVLPSILTQAHYATTVTNGV